MNNSKLQIPSSKPQALRLTTYYLLLTTYCILFPVSVRAEELPLPPDVYQIAEPVDIMMGIQPLKVQSFATHLSPEALQAFYAEALPRQGWRIEPFEWMAKAQEQQAELERSLAAHREELEAYLQQNPEAKTQLEQFQRYNPAKMAQYQLHAVRGDEHVLLHLSPQEQGKTLTFVNRWRDSDVPLGAAEEEASDETPSNACCNGEAVPQALRRIPWSVPQYPNARLIGTGAVSAEEAPLSELYFSREAREDIVAYYRDRMIYNGWTSVKDTGLNEMEMARVVGNQPVPVQASLLTYRNKQAYCGIVIAERSSDFMSRLGLPVGSAAAAPQGAEEPKPEERTVIMITYVELPSRP